MPAPRSSAALTCAALLHCWSGGGLDPLGLPAGRSSGEGGPRAEVGAGLTVVGGGLWMVESQPEWEPDEGDQERQGQQDVGPDNGTHGGCSSDLLGGFDASEVTGPGSHGGWR